MQKSVDKADDVAEETSHNPSLKAVKFNLLKKPLNKNIIHNIK